MPVGLPFVTPGRFAGPYESPAMRQSLGETLRPGGLALTRRALELAGLAPGARVLDAGCGQGASLGLLRGEGGFAATGLDPSAVMLSRASQKGPVLAGVAEALPFAAGVFAAALCECVLSLTRDKDAALADLRRVLAPGGLLLVSDVYRKQRSGEDLAPSPLAGGCLAGAEPLPVLFERLARAGLRLRHVEIRDRDLKELAARLILAHGSLEAFWQAVSGHGPLRTDGAPDLDSCGFRPGYCLVVAQKEATA